MSSFQNSPLSAENYEQKVQDCFNEVYEQIDSSYDKIGQLIDQILLDQIQPNVSNLSFQSISNQPFILSSLTFSNDYINPILTQQIISELQPSIKFIVQREVKNKEQILTQLFQSKLDKEIEQRKKEQTIYMEIIQKKDKEIQQINQNQYIEEKQKKQIIEVQNLNQFSFELIIENSIKQNETCCAIAFNSDQSIVVAGCSKDIKVFQHILGKLDQIQLLSQHTQNVNTLNFMKNKNNFISGSDDNTIIIWQMIKHYQWNFQQILNGHSGSLICLLLKNTDDLIISGSYDKTIKFWIKQDQWLVQQSINDHSNCVYSLCLNEQQNKVISCSNDKQILVIEQQKLDQKWIVTQKIKVDQYGYRLCFINDNQFTFQPYCTEQMQIYEIDINKKQYRKTKEITVNCGTSNESCLFPQQYLKSRCLLVNKNGKNINLIRKKENGEFIVEQSIEFSTYAICGSLSQDGEYLITWDDKSQEIQIRKCKE
ncbi:unnamed protein product [Paramecium pentaurelia]|uniref:WD40-repeat-containing domain n=1 Tax=Paramecium pentaurelia TaxID=43138 RepID=A0A8S1V669_9CILI|nr:unnamed protein product [Paramecium pentaurelia]